MKNKIKTHFATGILLAFSFYLLPLKAMDLTGNDLVLTDGSPQMFFNDTNESGFDWAIDAWYDMFRVYNYDTNQHLLWFTDTADMTLFMQATGFHIEDEGGNDIVSIHRDAPLSLDIQSDGDVSLADGAFYFDKNALGGGHRVGIGTTTPEAALEIQDNIPAIIFDDTTLNSVDWYVGNFGSGFVFTSQENGGQVNTQRLILDGETGNVGIGTIAPTAPLHVKHSDGNAAILVEETNWAQAARNLFVIKNNGNPEFQMINTGNNNSWKFSAGLNFVVKSDSGARVSVLSPAGNLTILGSIFTAGGSCGGGCDRLFDPETEVDSIEDHAAQMWSNSYLPAVGPTKENAPMNLSEKTGGILNELEKAHIYIEQLHTRNLSLEQGARAMEQRVAELEQLVTRLVTKQAEQVALN